MTIERFEREYLDYNAISPDRQQETLNVLRQLADQSGKPLENCDAQDFRAFLSHLLDSGLHVNTVAKKAGMIRPYFGWAFDVGIVSGDTLMAVKRVKDPSGASRQTTPKPYSQTELREFWAALDATWPLTTDLKLKRWRKGTSPYRSVWRHAMRLQMEAIVRLALDCGLRRNEIYSAGIDDIHPDNYYVVVHGKRENSREEKVREVPFTKASRLAVAAWLDFRSELKPRHQSVWLSLRPGRIPKTAYGSKAGRLIHIQPMRFERFDGVVGTCGPYTLHRFRHTCATHWLRAGVELEKVQRMLGHATLQQTLCYAEIVRDDIHVAMHKHEDAFERLANAQET